MQHAKSEAAFEEAKQYIPGGVNSPVRSFRSVGGVPPIIAGGCGSKLTDIDGNEYIDYVLLLPKPLKRLPKKAHPTAHRRWLKPNLPNWFAALCLPWIWCAW